MPFVVVHLSLGDTAGVAESFGLFRRRLTHLHSSQQEFLKSLLRYNQLTTGETPLILYSISAQIQGDGCQQRLLTSYVEKWSDVVNPEEGILVQSAYLQSLENPTSTEFSTIKRGHIPKIPHIHATQDVVSRYFDAVFLWFEDWKKVSKSLPEPMKTSSNKKVELLLTFSNANEISTAEIELGGKTSGKRFPNMFVSTLLVDLESIKDIEKHETAFKVLQRMSAKFTIGCRVRRDGVVNRTFSAAADVVKACDKVNGTMYVLTKGISMRKKDLYPLGYSFFYENVIRKELKEIKEFGDFILHQKPTAGIVFDVSIVPLYMHDEDSYTNFRNDGILNYNEFHEAMINWANCNNADMVLKPAIPSVGLSTFSAWLSYLRVNSMNSHYDIHELTELHPYFVLRNYPKDINNWTVEPCINWETSRPAIKASYFENKYVGAVFNADQIRLDKQLTRNEYKIMLQFVLNRFDLAEVVEKNNIKNFLAACNWLETSNNLVDGNNKILLNYQIPQALNASMVASNKDTLVLLFDELKENELKSIQGIHFDYSTNASSCIFSPTHPIFTAKDLLAETKIQNIKLGILLDYNCCLKYIQLLVSNNASGQQILTLLEQTEYLVCQEKHSVGNLKHETTMGGIFDSHLYLKRAYEEFSPHLDLYIRVTLTDFSTSSIRFSNAYMKTVSHFMQSATAYDLSYLIIQAFEEQTSRNGWWKIKNPADLTDPYAFVEREFDCTKPYIWRPAHISEEFIPDSEATSDIFIIVSIVAGILLTLCLVIISYIYLRYRRLAQFLSDDEVKEFMNVRSVDAEMAIESTGNAEYMKFKTEYDIPLSNLQIDTQTILGSGNFGTVYKGTAKETPAAIKRPNRDCSKTCFKSVLCEVKMLCYIGEHPNIAAFLGAYTKEIYKGILHVATEFCSNGALESFLRKKNNVVVSQQEQLGLSIPERERTLFLEDLYRFCFEIASGMDHIENKHIVHGDLSTRNVLLDDNYTCKIGDFGLSRKMYDYQKYVKTSQEPLPWKWMAHESLTKMEFTSKSDVWSFGVTCWEIFTLGSIPYSTYNWTIEFPDELKSGLRLTKPEFASEKIYLNMLDCWNLKPEQRPSFTELATFFRELHNNSYIVLGDDE